MKRLPGIQPSRGCTEPVAIALASALAARASTGTPLRVTVSCDRNTLKNAQRPVIPGTGGQRGPMLAAALGAIAGDPARELEVLSSITSEDVARAQELIDEGAVRAGLHPHEGTPRLWVEAVVETRAGVARARLEGAHTNLVALELDGVAVTPPAWATSTDPQQDPSWEDWTLRGILDLADDLDAEEHVALLGSLQANLIACGATGAEDLSGDLGAIAEATAEAGSQARMEGQSVTVVTSGFSGNQGLVATIPVGLVARQLAVDPARLARALAISHLVGSYVRSFTGVLSPLCNAVQAASAGAAAGCALLLGGGERELEAAAKRVLATTAGVACDGAKPACSLKVGLGASLAIRSAQRVVMGSALQLADGIAAGTLEETARNLGRLAHPGMTGVDEEILDIVLSKAPTRPEGSE